VGSLALARRREVCLQKGILTPVHVHAHAVDVEQRPFADMVPVRGVGLA